MASDLSKLIQDSFTLTLNGLLAKDAKILEITKAHSKDIDNLQMLNVKSSFEFTNFTSQLSYILPAKSCSLIFNTMMGSSIDELSDEIDDDAEDAIGEFVSNTSGTLTTSINSENLEDLGQTKFNIASKETIQSSSLTEIDKLYKYKIDLEDDELVIFILFDDELLPYIEDTAAVEVTHYEEETIEEIEETIEETIQSNDNDEVKENTPPLTQKPVTVDEEPQKVKKIKIETPSITKNKKLMMIIGGVATTIILFLIIYSIGMFDSEIKEEQNKTTKQSKIIDPNKADINKNVQPKKVDFKISDINKERLNNQLSELTKYKILSKDEIEAQKLAEKNRLFELEREKELLAFAKKNQEEPLITKEKSKVETITTEKTPNQNLKSVEIPTNDDITSIVTEKEMESSSVKKTEPILNYVITNSLKYSLFKSLVQETNTTLARISICNNDQGKTTIYIGPFETEELQNKMIELMKNKNIEIKPENITEENFNLKCNLE